MKKRDKKFCIKNAENLRFAKHSLVLIFGIFLVLFLLLAISFISAENLSDYSVNVTYEHPFLLSNGSYVPASQLKVGNTLRTTDGKIAVVKNITGHYFKNSFLVHNLEASPFHDFILSGNVVVHNSNLPPGWTAEEYNGFFSRLNSMGDQTNFIFKPADAKALPNELLEGITKTGSALNREFSIVLTDAGEVYVFRGDSEGVEIPDSLQGHVKEMWHNHPSPNPLPSAAVNEEFLRDYYLDVKDDPDQIGRGDIVFAIKNNLPYIEIGIYKDGKFINHRLRMPTKEQYQKGMRNFMNWQEYRGRKWNVDLLKYMLEDNSENGWKDYVDEAYAEPPTEAERTTPTNPNTQIPFDVVSKLSPAEKVVYARKLLGTLTIAQTDAIIDANQRGFSSSYLGKLVDSKIFTSDQMELLVNSGVFGEISRVGKFPRDVPSPYYNKQKLFLTSKEYNKMEFLTQYKKAQQSDRNLRPEKAVGSITADVDIIEELIQAAQDRRAMGMGSVSDINSVYDIYYLARSSKSGARVLIGPNDGKLIQGSWYVLILTDGNAYMSRDLGSILTKYPFGISKKGITQVLPVDCFTTITFKDGVPHSAVDPLPYTTRVYTSYEKAWNIFSNSLIRAPYQY